MTTCTEQIMRSVIELLEQREWESTRPADLVFGPVPPLTSWPAIGIVPSGHVASELAETQVDESFDITIINPLVPGTSSDTTAMMLAMRDEVRVVLAADPRLGLSFVRDTVYERSTLNLGPREDGEWEIISTISFRVTYLED